MGALGRGTLHLLLVIIVRYALTPSLSIHFFILPSCFAFYIWRIFASGKGSLSCSYRQLSLLNTNGTPSVKFQGQTVNPPYPSIAIAHRHRQFCHRGQRDPITDSMLTYLQCRHSISSAQPTPPPPLPFPPLPLPATKISMAETARAVRRVKKKNRSPLSRLSVDFLHAAVRVSWCMIDRCLEFCLPPLFYTACGFGSAYLHCRYQ